MQFLQQTFLFIKNDSLQIKRKWLSLPLLLLFPIIIISLLLFIILSLSSIAEDEAIAVGLVDLDETEETQLIMTILEESSLLGDYLHMHKMTEQEARQAISQNELATFILFPDQFTEKLYTGQSVEVEVIGNPKFPIESQFIRELINSVSRHISVSQASILTINEYAKEFSMDDETRNDYLYEQFTEFLFFTIGKDRVLNEEQLQNLATETPIYYYSLAAWFIVITLWFILMYNFLYKEESPRLKQRMKLYGVTELQPIIARGFVTIVSTSLLAFLSFHGLTIVLDISIPNENIGRIMILTILYFIIFLELLGCLELWIRSLKLRLAFQITVSIVILLLSGAIIPTIYFPLYVQEFIPFIFSAETFQWLGEIILQNRLYANYSPLLLTSTIGLVIFLVSSVWKERRQL